MRSPDREIEDVGEPLAAAGKPSRWEQFRLPVELEGRSFLDVGCWEGVHCAEAVRRGAREVVGVDVCTGSDLRENVDRYGFEFRQLDVFSERWLALGRFDVVLCSGLLYGVESPMSLIYRLRSVCEELLVIETGITRLEPERPMMVFHGAGEGTGNPSNWWTPNRLCLEQMLGTAGFEGISTVWEEERHEHYSRACLHAVPRGFTDRDRLMARKPRHMSIRGGNRRGGRRSGGGDAG